MFTIGILTFLMKLEKVGITINKTVLFLFKEAARKRRLEFIEKEKKQKDQVVFLLFSSLPSCGR